MCVWNNNYVHQSIYLSIFKCNLIWSYLCYGANHIHHNKKYFLRLFKLKVSFLLVLSPTSALYSVWVSRRDNQSVKGSTEYQLEVIRKGTRQIRHRGTDLNCPKCFWRLAATVLHFSKAKSVNNMTTLSYIINSSLKKQCNILLK